MNTELNIINANAERVAKKIVDTRAENFKPEKYIGAKTVVQLSDGETRVGIVEGIYGKHTKIPTLICRFENGTWTPINGTLFLA